MHEQQQRMQQEAEELAQRLEVILHDKFSHRHSGFDSDTPIDKALNFLQGCIAVSSCPLAMLPVVKNCCFGMLQCGIIQHVAQALSHKDSFDCQAKDK